MDTTQVLISASDYVSWKTFYLVVTGMGVGIASMSWYITSLIKRIEKKDGEYIKLTVQESSANRVALDNNTEAWRNNTEAWKDNAKSNRELILTLAKRRK